jgi:hypothetical protein
MCICCSRGPERSRNVQGVQGIIPLGTGMEEAMLTLEQIAEKARKHIVTPAERRAQRISLIMGLRSKNSTLTREEVTNFLDQNEGHETTEKR